MCSRNIGKLIWSYHKILMLVCRCVVFGLISRGVVLGLIETSVLLGCKRNGMKNKKSSRYWLIVNI